MTLTTQVCYVSCECFPATRQSIMKRLVDTVLGLLFAQVCCELGLPHRGIWRNEQLLFCWRRKRSWQVLLTSPLSFMGLGVYFQGFAGALRPSPVTVSLLFIRCARDGCGAESPSPESPGGSQPYSAVWFLHHPRQCAVVSSEPRGLPHPPVLHSFKDKAGWKIKCHHSPQRSPQLTAHFLFVDHRLGLLLLCCAAWCSPGTCSLYTNPPGAQPLLQPQSHREAPQGICSASCYSPASGQF